MVVDAAVHPPNSTMPSLPLETTPLAPPGIKDATAMVVEGAGAQLEAAVVVAPVADSGNITHTEEEEGEVGQIIEKEIGTRK